MDRQEISFKDLLVRPHHLWDEHWLLLTAGDFEAGRYNTMTVGWGSLGTMWGAPFAQVVVRPTRYTYQFMEQYDTFTLCAFPETYREALQLLGTKSGRDGDKIAEAGLTPVAASQIAAPAFAEASLLVECRKIYWQDLSPAHFITPGIEKHYPEQNYHRVYFGQIVALRGVSSFVFAG
ncbi:MAG TPA: flavin reductase family protein [Chloroflexi bacterium]|nr:flavin reductase family protein [Chloroflexota bacterium]